MAIPCSAEIHEILSIHELKKWTDTADENTLLVFDMDYTLVMLKNPAFHRPVFKKYIDWIEELEKSLTPDEEAIYAGVFMPNGLLCTVEPQIPTFIKSLQDRHLKMIVLTASPVGKIGNLPSVEDWRSRELLRLGIDVSGSFSDNSPTTFTFLNPARGYHPVFKNGILSTNGDANTKGQVLMAFLELINWKPSKVVFVDDRLAQLSSMEKTISPLGIDHIGIHYRGAEHVPSMDISEGDVKQAWLEVIEKTKTAASKKPL